MGAISYRDLRLSWQDSAFIEEGTVPSDATMSGTPGSTRTRAGGRIPPAALVRIRDLREMGNVVLEERREPAQAHRC